MTKHSGMGVALSVISQFIDDGGVVRHAFPFPILAALNSVSVCSCPISEPSSQTID